MKTGKNYRDIWLSYNILKYYDYISINDKEVLYKYIYNPFLVKLLKNYRYTKLKNIKNFIHKCYLHIDKLPKLKKYILRYGLSDIYINCFKYIYRNRNKKLKYYSISRYDKSQIKFFKDNIESYYTYKINLSEHKFLQAIETDNTLLYWFLKFYFYYKQKDIEALKRKEYWQKKYPKNVDIEKIIKLLKDYIFKYLNNEKINLSKLKKIISKNTYQKIYRWRKRRLIDGRKFISFKYSFLRLKKIFNYLYKKELEKKKTRRILKKIKKLQKPNLYERYLGLLNDIANDIINFQQKSIIDKKLKTISLKKFYYSYLKKEIKKSQYNFLKKSLLGIYDLYKQYLFFKIYKLKKPEKKVKIPKRYDRYVYEIREFLKKNKIKIINDFIKCSDYLLFAKTIYPDLVQGEYMLLYNKLYINISVKWFGYLSNIPKIKLKDKEVREYFVFIGYIFKRKSGDITKNTPIVRGYKWVNREGSHRKLLKKMFEKTNYIKNYKYMTELEVKLDRQEGEYFKSFDKMNSFFGIYA
ncbi:MAG: hypothetical protein QW474_01180 [Candidatus Aenigmatarchaeota archaeon]